MGQDRRHKAPLVPAAALAAPRVTCPSHDALPLMALPHPKIAAAGKPAGRGSRRPWWTAVAAVALLAGCEAIEPVVAPQGEAERDVYTGPERVAMGGEGPGAADEVPERPALRDVPSSLDDGDGDDARDGAGEGADDEVTTVADAGDRLSTSLSEAPAEAGPETPASRPQAAGREAAAPAEAEAGSSGTDTREAVDQSAEADAGRQGEAVAGQAGDAATTADPEGDVGLQAPGSTQQADDGDRGQASDGGTQQLTQLESPGGTSGDGSGGVTLRAPEGGETGDAQAGEGDGGAVQTRVIGGTGGSGEDQSAAGDSRSSQEGGGRRFGQFDQGESEAAPSGGQASPSADQGQTQGQESGGVTLNPPENGGTSAGGGDGGAVQTRVIGGDGNGDTAGSGQSGGQRQFDLGGSGSGETQTAQRGAEDTGERQFDLGGGGDGTTQAGQSGEQAAQQRQLDIGGEEPAQDDGAEQRQLDVGGEEPVQDDGAEQRQLDVAGDGGSGLANRTRADADGNTALNPAFYRNREQVLATLRRAQGGTRARVGRIGFAHGSAALNSRDQRAINALAEMYARLDRPVEVAVIGHASRRVNTDAAGEARARNRRMAERRATAVATALAAAGIADSRIDATSAGAETPRYSEVTPGAEAGNRRATVVFVLR